MASRSRTTKPVYQRVIAWLMSSRARGCWLPAIVILHMLRQCAGSVVLRGTWPSTCSRPSDKIVLTPLGWRVVGHHLMDGPGRVVFVLHRQIGVAGHVRTSARIALVRTNMAVPPGYTKGRATT